MCVKGFGGVGFLSTAVNSNADLDTLYDEDKNVMGNFLG